MRSVELSFVSISPLVLRILVGFADSAAQLRFVYFFTSCAYCEHFGVDASTFSLEEVHTFVHPEAGNMPRLCG